MDRPLLWAANALIYLRHPRAMLHFRRCAGYFPNPAQPRRAGEKMLWRKLFDHDPRFVTCCDKLATRALQARLCPTLATAEVLWSGRDAAGIPAAALQRPVVIKASHGCGDNLFRRRGAAELPLRPRGVRRLNRWLRRAYGRRLLEWAYQEVDRRLFVEALILPPAGGELLELGVHVVDGRPLFIEAIRGNKTPGQSKGYFHPDGRRWPEIEPVRQLPGTKPPLPADFQLPPGTAEALAHSQQLAARIGYLRCDFLIAGERVYGGEMVVYPGSGLARLSEFAAYDALLTSRWDLATSWFLTTPQRGLRRRYANALSRALAAQRSGA